MIFSKQSLTQTTIIKMGIRIASVIILMTLLSYWHIVSVLKLQTLEQLEKYIIERGKRESNIFLLAQDNHFILKNEFERQLKELGKKEPQEQFEQFFTRWSDGTTRDSPKDQSPEDLDTTIHPSVFIGPQVNINADIQRRVLTFYKLLSSYGPAWHNRFVNTYINAPENIVSAYWAGEPWGLSATTDFYIPNEEYFYVSDKTHNPERKQAWTGLYFDHVVKLWMVSVETPIDDNQGKHIATIGHDIILNELLDRTITAHIEGAYNIIFREDGRLIAHPQYMTQIMDAGGEFDILKSGNQHLLDIFQSVKSRSADTVVVENNPNNEYLAVTKIDGPDKRATIKNCPYNIQRGQPQ